MPCFCCNNVLNLGCYPYCGELEFPINAESDGKYRMETDFIGRPLVYDKDQTSGTPIKFPNVFNENYRYLAKLYDETGAEVTVTITDGEGNDVVYDCFSFSVQYTYQEDLDPPITP